MPTAPAEIIPESYPSPEESGTQPEKSHDPEPSKHRRVWIIMLAALIVVGAIVVVFRRSRSDPAATGSSARTSAADSTPSSAS